MTEEWRPVVGYEGVYKVSNFGHIKSISTGRNRTLRIRRDGYLQIILSNKPSLPRTYLVHKIVLDAFVGKCPNGLEANHIDGNKQNARLDNLEYVTKSENQLHRVNVLGKGWGENSVRHKLTNAQVFEVVAMRAAGHTQQAIADKHGVTQGTISTIDRRETRRPLWRSAMEVTLQ